MSAEEYRFDPARIVVKARGRAARLRIVLANRGSLAHNIHVRDGDGDLADTPSFQPGRERAVAARLSPGTYDFRCTVGDHEELGMTGRIEVR
jgi:plastocyanin